MRTEEDKVFKEPITVILGGHTYEIAPLVIKESREWRKKVAELMVSLPKITTANSPESFESALNTLFATTPDRIIDLFFDYAKDLNREEIEAKATDVEVAEAFSMIMKVAFPLAKSLTASLSQ